jgi:hypothetical protein
MWALPEALTEYGKFVELSVDDQRALSARLHSYREAAESIHSWILAPSESMKDFFDSLQLDLMSALYISGKPTVSIWQVQSVWPSDLDGTSPDIALSGAIGKHRLVQSVCGPLTIIEWNAWIRESGASLLKLTDALGEADNATSALAYIVALDSQVLAICASIAASRLEVIDRYG